MITEYKGFQIKPNKEVPSLYEVVVAGRGGKIPNDLKSSYTQIPLAMFAIDRYCEVRENRGKKNDKELSSG